jgi:carbon monoxide dehydrogenase subunit G
VAKFPTTVERSVVVRVPVTLAYQYLSDVARSAGCIPSIARCERVGEDTWHFASKERSVGPITMSVCYTARYQGNGKDRIVFRSVGAEGDSADIDGTFILRALGEDTTRIELRQMIAPETPVPRLLQGVIRSFVEREAAGEIEQFLDGVRRALESG